MERPTRILEWVNTGYQMENTAHWANGFRPSRCGYAIGHDLFHHRYDESGQHWEEVRALGAMLYFYPLRSKDYKKYRYPPEAVLNTLVKDLAYDEVLGKYGKELADTIDIPKDVLKHYLTYFETTSERYKTLQAPFLKLITAGYKYATKLGRSVKKFNEIREFDFSTLWNENHFRNIEVNLETAEVKLV